MIPKIIFITGCSSGIGYHAALALKSHGYRVIASCRKMSDVERLQQLGLDVVQMDVNEPLSVTAGIQHMLEKTAGHIDVLINNAGYGQAGALEDVTREGLIAQFNTNVFGLMEVTRGVIPIMRAQGHGRIINISSVLGFISMPFRGAYNASKYAVEGLSDTLRLELKPAGIHVITIEPGPITSRFREHAVKDSMRYVDFENSHFKAQYLDRLTHFEAQKDNSPFTREPSAVIHKLIKAIEANSPKPKYLVTIPTYAFMILKRILSVKWLDRFITFCSKKEMQ